MNWEWWEKSSSCRDGGLYFVAGSSSTLRHHKQAAPSVAVSDGWEPHAQNTDRAPHLEESVLSVSSAVPLKSLSQKRRLHLCRRSQPQDLVPQTRMLLA